MYYYEDLAALGEIENKGEFCKAAVDSFKTSEQYKIAKDGEIYYSKHNATIENFQKWLYTVSGDRVKDIFSANYKLKSLIFRRLVIDQVQYVLGNGVSFEDDSTKEKLGENFDYQIQMAAIRAMASGVGFGFWNVDHLEVFGYADTKAFPGFCPLYSQSTSELMAGVRYWYKKVGDKLKFCCTLYEVDGFTEYIENEDDEIVIAQPKRGYIRKVIYTPAGGVEEYQDENYTTLPIIPMYANDLHESELVGVRECIDCYDYIKSGLANDIDDTAGFYWILENTGGMDDTDLAQFIQRIKTIRAAVVDGDTGVKAEPHTMAIPTEARQTMLDILRRDIYEDFQGFDVNQISAGQKTATEINASYQPMDNKCAYFEYNVITFIQKLLRLVGISDNPTFKWQKIANMVEETQMVMSAAAVLTDEIILRHLPFLTPEEAEEVIRTKDEETQAIYSGRMAMYGDDLGGSNDPDDKSIGRERKEPKTAGEGV